jgi:hypothetical protein
MRKKLPRGTVVCSRCGGNGFCSRCGGTGLLPDDRVVGKKMREFRKGCTGWTGRALARAIGISAAYLSDLELGKRHWHTEIQERYWEKVTE